MIIDDSIRTFDRAKAWQTLRSLNGAQLAAAEGLKLHADYLAGELAMRPPISAWQGKCGHIWTFDRTEPTPCPTCTLAIEVERLRAGLDELNDGQCGSAYGNGCDGGCQGFAGRVLRGEWQPTKEAPDAV